MKSVQFSIKRISFVEKWYPIILAVLAIIIFLPGLGEGSLRDWDEAIYAQVSREIIQSGKWITLHYKYEPWFEKPPLLMWITALFFKLFGVNEFWARATSAISGILIVFITYLNGKQIYNRRIGFLAGLVLLGCYGFVFEARNGETDMLLSLFVFSGIFGYLRLKNSDPKWWYVIWASCALAFMTKFWAGLVLPITIAITLVLDWKIKETIRNKHFWLGGLLAIFMVTPWHLLVYMQNGMAFLDVYITRYLLKRTLNVMEGLFGTQLFYFDTLRRLFSPWYYLFPFALVFPVREMLERKHKSHIIFVEILLIFGLYTFVVKTKNPSYIFPIFPALSILTARLFVVTSSFIKTSAYIWIITAALIASAVIPDKLLILFILIIMGSLFLLKMNVIQKKQFQLIITYTVFTTFFLSNILSYMLGNHRIRIWPIYGLQVSPVAQIATFTRENHSATSTYLICFALVEDWASTYAVEGPTAVFYSNRPIVKVTTWDQLKETMEEQNSSEILIARKYISELSEEYRVEIIEEVTPLVYAKISH